MTGYAYVVKNTFLRIVGVRHPQCAQAPNMCSFVGRDGSNELSIAQMRSKSKRTETARILLYRLIFWMPPPAEGNCPLCGSFWLFQCWQSYLYSIAKKDYSSLRKVYGDFL